MDGGIECDDEGTAAAAAFSALAASTIDDEELSAAAIAELEGDAFAVDACRDEPKSCARRDATGAAALEGPATALPDV